MSIAPRTLLTFILLSAAVLILGGLTYAIRTILVQLLVATVLAMALEPLVQVFERRGIRQGESDRDHFHACGSRPRRVRVSRLRAPGFGAQSVANDLPGLLRELTHGRGRLGFLETRYHVVEEARAAVKRHGAEGATGTLSIVTRVVSTGGAIVFVAFLTLFMQLGGRQWFDSLVRLVPASQRARVQRTGTGVSRAVGGYVSGNLLISVIAGSVTTVVLLATHVPYAVPLGIAVAILDLLPLVGATIRTVLVGSVALTKGIPTTAIVVGAMLLYQQVENHTLQQLVYQRGSTFAARDHRERGRRSRGRRDPGCAARDPHRQAAQGHLRRADRLGP